MINWNNLLFDFVGMIRSWVSTMGIFILASVAQYLIDNQTWDWKQLLIAAIVAGAKYLVTRFDHTVAKQALQTANNAAGEPPAPVVAQVKNDENSKGDTAK